jgi:hypothetical protein
MRNTPPLSGALHAHKSLQAYSNNREIDLSERFLIFLVARTEPRFGEPEELRKARHRIATAKIASDHLLSEGLSPIFDSFEFEVLSVIGLA